MKLQIVSEGSHIFFRPQNNTLVSTDNKGMAAYLFECKSDPSYLQHINNALSASVEPNTTPGNTTFVAGFTQCEFLMIRPLKSWTKFLPMLANVGDTSPNTSVYFMTGRIATYSQHFSSLGAFCESPGEDFDGQPCEFEHSTCGGKTQPCHGRCVKKSCYICLLTLSF